MFKLKKESLKNLEGIHPNLVMIMAESIKTSLYEFSIVDGIRTVERQQNLYLKGREKPGVIVTNADGIKYKSNHQIKNDGYGYAVDLYPYINGKIRTSYDKYKKEFEAIAEHILKKAKKFNIDIVWGGHWTDPFDPPHFELRKRDEQIF